VLATAAAAAHVTVHAGKMAAAEAADERWLGRLQTEEVAPERIDAPRERRPWMRTHLRTGHCTFP
jgi:hypothetical protein